MKQSNMLNPVVSMWRDSTNDPSVIRHVAEEIPTIHGGFCGWEFMERCKIMHGTLWPINMTTLT